MAEAENVARVTGSGPSDPRPGFRSRWVLLSASLLAACLLCEGLCRVYLWLCPSTGPIGRWEFRAQCPPPYQGAEYYSHAFLAESMQCISMRNPPVSPHYPVHGDYQGRYINVKDGLRRTTDTPERPANRVLLFGGSTIFCSEVPDEWTIASCLQRLLNRRSGRALAVENHGTCSVIARQQTERLLATPLQPGDIVIFYDGFNDVCYPVFNGTSRGWRPGDGNDNGVRRLSRFQRKLYPLCFHCMNYSAMARVLFKSTDASLPMHIADRGIMAANLEAAEDGYSRALIEANRAVARQGGRFFHFLQPHIFTSSASSHYERRVIRNELKVTPRLDTTFELGYPRLRKALEVAAENGVVSFDLSDALKERQPRQQYYLDFCHVNHTANERVAQRIHERIFESAP